MTKRCLSVRLKEHPTQLTTSAIGKHLSDCEHAQYLASLQNHYSLLNDIPLPSDNVPTPIENLLVFNNVRILHLTSSTSYNIFAFLEALLIKYNNPQLKTAKSFNSSHNDAPSTFPLSTSWVSACLFVNVNISFYHVNIAEQS